MVSEILIVTPAPPGSTRGNRVTAERWASILRDLDKRVEIAEEYDGQACDLLVALHATRSAPSVERYRNLCPVAPLVVTLTGTDLYRDLPGSAAARASIEAADFLITLHRLATREVPGNLRDRVRTIYQSVALPAALTASPPRLPADRFQVCVVGHLRPVKDPFRTAWASRALPETSRIEVVHAGGALSQEAEEDARQQAAENPRYRWLGAISREKTLELIAGSHLMSLTSILEGGANVLGEAIAVGTPVVCTEIAGSVGILGETYPGYFPVGETRPLTRLLRRAEEEPEFLEDLRDRCREIQPLFNPRREKEAWQSLLREIEDLAQP